MAGNDTISYGVQEGESPEIVDPQIVNTIFKGLYIEYRKLIQYHQANRNTEFIMQITTNYQFLRYKYLPYQAVIKETLIALIDDIRSTIPTTTLSQEVTTPTPLFTVRAEGEPDDEELAVTFRNTEQSGEVDIDHILVQTIEFLVDCMESQREGQVGINGMNFEAEWRIITDQFLSLYKTRLVEHQDFWIDKLLETSRLYFNMQEYKVSLAFLVLATEADKRVLKTINSFHMGLNFCYVEQYDEALAHFNYTITYFPEKPSGYVGNGLVYFNMGDLSSAYHWASQALEKEPNDITSWELKVAVLKALGRYEESLVATRILEQLKENQQLLDSKV